MEEQQDSLGVAASDNLHGCSSSQVSEDLKQQVNITWSQVNSSNQDQQQDMSALSFNQLLIRTFETGFNSDAWILVGHGSARIKIPVHKQILTLGSATIPLLFAQSELQDTLVLDDVEVEPFKLFLRILYGDTQVMSMQKAHEVLQLAIRFKSPEPARASVCNFPSTIDAAIVCQAFEFANDSNNPLLLDAIQQFVLKNASRLVETEEFSFISSQCLEGIINKDDLQVKSEVQLFNYVIRWGRAAALKDRENPSNRKVLRSYIKPLLRSIRFPRIRILDLFNVVVPAVVLTRSELSPLLLTRCDFETQSGMTALGLPAKNCNIKTLRELNKSIFSCEERKYLEPIEVDLTDSDLDDGCPQDNI